MTVVAHSSDDDPVLFLIGYGFRPAYQPADYIGPRMDCPMWLPVPDADVAYLAKWDGPLKYEMTPLDIIPESEMIQVIKKMISKPSEPSHKVTWHPPHWGEWPPFWNPPGGCDCPAVIGPPESPVYPAPVPLPESGLLIIVGLAALAAFKRKMARR